MDEHSRSRQVLTDDCSVLPAHTHLMSARNSRIGLGPLRAAISYHSRPLWRAAIARPRCSLFRQSGAPPCAPRGHPAPPDSA
jgi:hypothetical protein